MNKQYIIQSLDSTCAGWTDLHGFYKYEIKNTDEEMIEYVTKTVFNNPDFARSKLRLVTIVPLAYSKNVTEKEK